MAVVDATVSGLSANSYVSIADANSYFSLRLGGTTAWASIADPHTALITATAQLELRRYTGFKTIQNQALKWPRGNVEDDENVLLPADAIPARIKQACCELALTLGTDATPTEESGLEGLKSIQLDQGVRFDFTSEASSSGGLPGDVIQLISIFLMTDQGELVRS